MTKDYVNTEEVNHVPANSYILSFQSKLLQMSTISQKIYTTLDALV